MSGFVIVVSIIAAIGGLLFGYDTGVISGAILFIKQAFQLTPTAVGVTVSAGLVGAVIGAALGGILGDRDGRKKMIILAAIIFGVGAIITAVTPNLPILIAGRATVGIGIGLASFIAPGTEAGGLQGIPLAAGLHHKQEGIHRLSVRYAGGMATEPV